MALQNCLFAPMYYLFVTTTGGIFGVTKLSFSPDVLFICHDNRRQIWRHRIVIFRPDVLFICDNRRQTWRHNSPSLFLTAEGRHGVTKFSQWPRFICDNKINVVAVILCFQLRTYTLSTCRKRVPCSDKMSLHLSNCN